MTDISSRLQEFDSLEGFDEKVVRYNELVSELVERQNVTGLKMTAAHLIDSEEPPVSRPILVSFAEAMGLLDIQNQKNLGQEVLKMMLAKKGTTYEESVQILRRMVSRALETENKMEEAARMLEDLIASKAPILNDDAHRAAIFTKVASLYLRSESLARARCQTLEDYDRNPTFRTALDFHKKAAAIQNKIVDRTVRFEFQVNDATILNWTGSFLKAADRFHKLSLMPNLSEGERMNFLSSSVNCLFLAPAGPQRSRLLNSIYKDDRSALLPAFDVLESMFLERLVKGPDVEKLRQHLSPHQVPLLGKALMSHNLLAASKIYDNITFAQLSTLLGVRAEEAEETAATMILEGRMSGSIDQVAGILTYTSSLGSLAQWDSEIADVCHSVNHITDAIAQRFPQLPR